MSTHNLVGQAAPAELTALMLTRLTSNNEEIRDEEDDVRAFAVRSLLTTETAATTDSERDEDDDFALLAQATLSTVTKATGDQEGDPDDDPELLAHGALLTTLTESSGDNESDPDDDRLIRATGGRPGGTLPLAYRYAEREAAHEPRLTYDPQRQLHVLKGGIAVIDAIRELAAPIT